MLGRWGRYRENCGVKFSIFCHSEFVRLERIHSFGGKYTKLD